MKAIFLVIKSRYGCGLIGVLPLSYISGKESVGSIAKDVQSAARFHAANPPPISTYFDTCPCRMFHDDCRREVRLRDTGKKGKSRAEGIGGEKCHGLRNVIDG